MAELQREVEALRARERSLHQTFAKELGVRVLRASNENSSYFEASQHALKQQQQRELKALQEDLEEVRRRSAASLEKEVQLRRRAQLSEEELRSQLHLAADKMATLEIELQRARTSLEAEQREWRRERKKLVAEHESAVAGLTQERDQGLEELKQQFQERAAEIQSKYDKSLSSLRGNEMELLRQQWDGEKSRLAVEMHKRSQKDQEVVRTEERRLAMAEIENLRKAYQSRERQTAADLLELEKLHSSRVRQLEQELDKERAGAQRYKEELAAAFLQIDRMKKEGDYNANEWKGKFHELHLRNDELERELNSASQAVGEMRSSEQSHREQAKQALAELRLQQAEVAELKRQASENASSAFQWRKLVSEQEHTVANSATASRIAKEEVALLEHQLQRYKQENHDLRLALQKAERLIFGVPQSQPPKNSYPLPLDSRSQPPLGSPSTPMQTQLNSSASSHYSNSALRPAAFAHRQAGSGTQLPNSRR